jgi:predicted small lipoprotein YifL
VLNKLLLAALISFLLQGCGLKSDLYLEEDPDATVREQEQTEYLEDSVEQQSDEIETEQDVFQDEEEEILSEPEIPSEQIPSKQIPSKQ